jgi:gamma-glutamylcyclotransferase
MTERYFAYGSNLWIDQMIERTGPLRTGAERPRVALLANYRVVFNMRWDQGQAFANLMSPGEGVHGVVYCCCAETLEKMDAFEKGYERKRVRVVLEGGEELNAFTYFAQAANIGTGSQPSAEYLQRILCGAKQHGLPETYIRELEASAKIHGCHDDGQNPIRGASC